MREIKFRAWDKVNEKIVYDGKKLSNIWTDYDVLINLKGEIFLGADHTNDCCRLHVDGDDPTENYLLMQYTGLKDKNGAEIYEGNILKQENEIAEVEWDVGYEGDGFPCSGFVIGYRDFAYSDIEKPDYEIIGNIYENPELLK